MKANNNPGLNDAYLMMNNANKLYQQDNFPEALNLYQQSSIILERLAPNGERLGVCHEIMGEIYDHQGRLVDALRCFEKALLIQKDLADNELALASLYGKMGDVYGAQGNLSVALNLHEKALFIRERLAPDSTPLAKTYNNIGCVYDDQGNLPDALTFFEKSLRIHERLNPNGLSVAVAYTNIGDIYREQGRLQEALAYHEKALSIKERLVPNSLSIANTYCIVGEGCAAQHKLPEALTFFDKALRIRERLAPDSLSVATACYNIAEVYKTQGKFKEALPLLEKAFRIKSRDLIPTHGDLIALSHNTASLALRLNQLEAAQSYIDICIQKDNTFKYAHDVKGLILQKQGKLDEALSSFNQALVCDPGYADALLHKADLLEKAGCARALMHTLEQARRIKLTDYDKDLKSKYATDGAGTKQAMEARFPTQEYQSGDQKLDAKLSELTLAIAGLNHRVDGVERRVDTLESRMTILETKVYTLEHSMTILRQTVSDIDARLKQVTDDNDLVDLLLERRKMAEREHQIKRFNKQADLSDFYHALLSEMSAIFIATMAISSNEIERQGTHTATQAGDAVGVALSLLPVVGTLASRLTKGIGIVVDTRQNVIDKNKLLRIKEVVPTVEEFDKIALRVAVQLTLANETRILQLNGANVPRDWKAQAGRVLTDGLEGLMATFINDNSTLAKLWGRAEAQAIITHLQEPKVAENYRYEEEQGARGTPAHKSRLSVVANSIFGVRLALNTEKMNRLAHSTTLNLEPLIREGKTFSSSKPAKKAAVDELIWLLECRNSGDISSRRVVEHLSHHLDPKRSAIFGQYWLRSCRTQTFFMRCLEVLNRDIQQHPDVQTDIMLSGAY